MDVQAGGAGAAHDSASHDSAAHDSAADDTGCHIVHVDMDAFYASVEVRDRPDLAGRPVIVGGLSGRSVVLSATYQARAFGVRSAMPMSRARRLCPQATVLPPRHRLYSAVSKEVMAIFRAVTPLVEPLSLDEAFLDVSGAIRLFGSPAEIGQQIRRQVAQQQQITCSVGVATSKFLAKLASVHCKPDGLLVIPAGGALEFLHPLPVSALWGVGDKTRQVLSRLGLRTVGDIAGTPLDALERDLGKAVAAHLYGLANGRDERAVASSVREKSVGSEETFDADISDPVLIRRELLRLSRGTACALYAASGLSGQTRLRLVGVRAAGLVPAAAAATQLTLEGRGAAWREAESALDKIAGRFGPDAIRPATLVEERRVGPESRDQGR